LEYGGLDFICGTRSESSERRRSRILEDIRFKVLSVGKRGREFGDLVMKEVERGGRESRSWGLIRKRGRSVAGKKRVESGP
jgi:hypothetical protein